MSTKLTSLLDQFQALATPPLASAPSTAGNSMFALASDLQATVNKIRAIEASNPSLAKFPTPKVLAGCKFANKADFEKATAHLKSIAHLAPKASAPAPAAKPQATAPKLNEWQQFQALKKSNPAKANAFWNENKTQIIKQAPH